MTDKCDCGWCGTCREQEEFKRATEDKDDG